MRGKGRGRGNRTMFIATGLTGNQLAASGMGAAEISSAQKLTLLRNQSRYMEEQLEWVRARISELEKEGKE